MNFLAIINTSIAGTALFLSIFSLWRTQKLQKKQLELDKVNAELSRRLMRQMDQDEQAKGLADVTAELDDQHSSLRFRIRNIGHAAASNVSFQILNNNRPMSGLAPESEKKLPYHRLESGQSFTLELRVPSWTAKKGVLEVCLEWENSDGSPGSKTVQLSG